MSRRNHRRFQSAQSLMQTRHKPCDHDGCLEDGLVCYDEPGGRPVARYCMNHRAEHGHCYDCGVKADGERFKAGPGKGFCDDCWALLMEPRDSDYLDYVDGDDWPAEVYEDEMDF